MRAPSRKQIPRTQRAPYGLAAHMMPDSDPGFVVVHETRDTGETVDELGLLALETASNR